MFQNDVNRENKLEVDLLVGEVKYSPPKNSGHRLMHCRSAYEVVFSVGLVVCLVVVKEC